MDVVELIGEKISRVISKYEEEKAHHGFTKEERELWQEKINGIDEIMLFVEFFDQDWFLNRTRKPVSQMSDEAYRTSKHRFKKELLSKIGEDTFDNIARCDSSNELKDIMESFRTKSGFRNIKRAFLVDLYNESISEGDNSELTSVQKLQRLVTIRDKTNSCYGNYDRLKLKFIESFRIYDDQYFTYTKEAASLFANNKKDFEELIGAIKIDIDNFDRNQKGVSLQ